MSIQQKLKTLHSHRIALQAFLPRTLDERMARMHERIGQVWPAFGVSGMYGPTNGLYLSDHDGGTIVRFFANDGKTFHHIGVVKHGAHWHLSEPIDGLSKMSSAQLQNWMFENKLNWVVTR